LESYKIIAAYFSMPLMCSDAEPTSVSETTVPDAWTEPPLKRRKGTFMVGKNIASYTRSKRTDHISSDESSTDDTSFVSGSSCASDSDIATQGKDLVTKKLDKTEAATLKANLEKKLQHLKEEHNLEQFEDNPTLFEETAANVLQESNPGLGYFVLKNASTASAIRIQGFDYGDLYPTSKERCTNKTLIPYAVAAGVSHLLKCGVVGWHKEVIFTNPFFHDIRPVKGGKEGSNGAGEPLNFHQDMSFEYKKAPEWLSLICLREGCDPDVRTPVVVNRQLYEWVEQNHPEDLAIFKDPNAYKVQLPLSTGGAFVDPMPLLTGDCAKDATFWLRVHYDRIIPQTPAAAEAFERLKEAMKDLANNEVHLVDGDLLLISNKKCLHRRTDFKASFTGEDRLLIRSYLKRHDGLPSDGTRFMDPEWRK